jgi:hypothetical protein
MKSIIPFNDYLNEAIQSKAINVENEQKNQTVLNDKIKEARLKLSKIDATNKKQFEKTMLKSQLTQTIAKLTAAIAQSMNKEAQALQALSQEQAKS